MSRPRAIIIFGSGDGGWGAFENTLSTDLCAHGYEVVGIDSADYASTDYDLSTLEADIDQISEKVLEPYGNNPPPLLEGGWSMGAAQAIAIAGGPNPPRNLKGLILASALSRGRFGLREADKANVLPTGAGTFAVKDFAPSFDRLRVAQWHGAEDDIDSTAWLSDLHAVHREYDLPDAGHTYNQCCDAFRAQFLESVDWVLNPPPEELHASDY